MNADALELHLFRSGCEQAKVFKEAVTPTGAQRTPRHAENVEMKFKCWKPTG